ncbi:acyl-CoA thioesterase [Pyrodictium delaneyi]|uniref:Acyl-CoA thioesterase n=2 Tax=Pyrodictium delaneyi TaxID=1273541 RepID=A0A211YRE0_9CREN|nr:acyl-CoA thioesterase [Pyrodictium delaneyi]OWJ55506.1 acyl-CoA thioesterase [Pyrodictium delaneyi]
MTGRRLCIEESLVTLLHPIYPRHTNRYGTLHGGRLAGWMLEAGGMASMRAARGYTVLGAMDYLFILSPGRVGENLHVYAWVVGSTQRTLDVLVYAEARPLGGAEPRPVSLSLQTYVAVDENVRPREHGVEVAACSLETEPLVEAHRYWLEARLPLIEKRREIAGSTAPLDAVYRKTSYFFTSPEDTFTIPTVMDASRLFYQIDQMAAVPAIEYTGAAMVTAGFDAVVFASPARVGDLVKLEAGITGAGRSSLEVAVRVAAYNPVTEDRERTVALLYATMVAVDEQGRPQPLPRRPVLSDERMQEYLERRRVREERRRIAWQLIEHARELVRGR